MTPRAIASTRMTATAMRGGPTVAARVAGRVPVRSPLATPRSCARRRPGFVTNRRCRKELDVAPRRASLWLERPAVLGAPAHDLEAAALVHPERAGLVLAIDAERAFGHPALPQQREARRDQRASQAPTPPRPPDADVLDPSTLDAQPLVLLRMDVAPDHPRDVRAVPGHAPQARVGLHRVVEELVALALARFREAPVVAERLDLRLEDRVHLVCPDLAD